MTEPSRLPK